MESLQVEEAVKEKLRRHFVEEIARIYLLWPCNKLLPLSDLKQHFCFFFNHTVSLGQGSRESVAGTSTQGLTRLEC